MDSDGYAQASIRNLMLKNDYTVTQSPKGEIWVTWYYYINVTTKEHTVSVRKFYRPQFNWKFEIGDEGKANHKEFVILRVIDNSDLLIQRIEDYTAQRRTQTAAAMMFGGSAPFYFLEKSIVGISASR